jgi:hypothetical protein
MHVNQLCMQPGVYIYDERKNKPTKKKKKRKVGNITGNHKLLDIMLNSDDLAGDGTDLVVVTPKCACATTFLKKNLNTYVSHLSSKLFIKFTYQKKKKLFIKF